MNPNQPYNALPFLPPDINVDCPGLLRKAILANRALAELKGTVRSVPNQQILVNGIILQEAKLSSEIENIFTTTDELYRASANPDSTTDPFTKEVLLYRQAMWHGLDAIKLKPLSINTFIDIVSITKQATMDVRKIPGTKIASNNNEIIYTPPEGKELILEKLSNLVKFIHEEDTIDPLIKLALIHYQFEAIHPFTDGNGRTGRIINILYLIEKQLLDNPILFLSHHILKTKSDYYKLLRQVTEKAAWNEWILYMLNAVEVTAKETLARVNSILSAMNDARDLLSKQDPKIYSKDLIEAIFFHPYSKVRFLEEAGIAKRQTAAVYLKRLEVLGLLRSQKIGREVYYINSKLVEILSQ